MCVNCPDFIIIIMMYTMEYINKIDYTFHYFNLQINNIMLFRLFKLFCQDLKHFIGSWVSGTQKKFI